MIHSHSKISILKLILNQYFNTRPPLNDHIELLASASGNSYSESMENPVSI
jgi:hypothetical protein